jgi:CubicO group peptidase (beta-lactamase class C family)
MEHLARIVLVRALAALIATAEAAVALQPTCGVPSPVASPSAEVVRRVQAVENDVSWAQQQIADQPRASIRERMAHYGVAGLSIAVIANYRIEWARGYGWADVAARRPVTPITRFMPGSISKAVNAATIMRLVDAGTLDLKTDVNQYLRGWQFPYGMLTKGQPITLAALLSHTAGLGVGGFWGYNPGDPLPSVEQILDGLPPAGNEPVRSQFPPGVRFQYSGGGTMISQLVVSSATQRAYDRVVQERVLRPLGMTCSSMTQPPASAPRAELATGYSALGAPVPGGHAIMPEQAAAGLWTTPTDLARFLIDVQRALRAEPGSVLSMRSAQRMTTRVLRDAPGMGFFLVDSGGARYFEHGAGNSGFSGWMIGSLHGGNGVVVLQNGESEQLLSEVVNTVARVYDWPVLGRRLLPRRTTVPMARATLARYVGTYRDRDTFVQLLLRGDTLWYQASGAPWRVYFSAPGRFFSLESLSEKVVTFDAQGRVDSFVRVVRDSVLAPLRRVNELQLDEHLRSAYAGRYRDARRNSVHVVERAGGLRLRMDGAERVMHFVSPQQFFTTEDFQVPFRMLTGASGRVIGISMDRGAGTETAYRESR